MSFSAYRRHSADDDTHRDNIRYDLMRTGNVEVTSNKVLERGYLDAVSH